MGGKYLVRTSFEFRINILSKGSLWCLQVFRIDC